MYMYMVYGLRRGGRRMIDLIPPPIVHITHRAAWPHDDVDCTLTIHSGAAPSWRP